MKLLLFSMHGKASRIRYLLDYLPIAHGLVIHNQPPWNHLHRKAFFMIKSTDHNEDILNPWKPWSKIAIPYSLGSNNILLKMSLYEARWSSMQGLNFPYLVDCMSCFLILLVSVYITAYPLVHMRLSFYKACMFMFWLLFPGSIFHAISPYILVFNIPVGMIVWM